MDFAYGRMNHVELFDRVIAGIEDEHEIKVICMLMLTKLIAVDLEEVQRRLDAVAEKFRVNLNFKPKDSAVKQELEKLAETNKTVLLTTVKLQNAFPNANTPSAGVQHQVWRSYVDWVWKEHKDNLNRIENELKRETAQT